MESDYRVPGPEEQETQLFGKSLDWDGDTRRTVEVTAERLYKMIEGTHTGYASPKSAGYKYEDVYEFLAGFNVTTKIKFSKGEGVRLGSDIYIPRGGPVEMYEEWMVNFNSGYVHEDGDYLRVHHD